MLNIFLILIIDLFCQCCACNNANVFSWDIFFFLLIISFEFAYKFEFTKICFIVVLNDFIKGISLIKLS